MKLIDKSVVVAKIERLRNYPDYAFEESIGYYNALDEITTFLNTLEEKKVDLEEEIEAEMKRFAGNLTCREECYKFAKHFFELGLKVQKGE